MIISGIYKIQSKCKPERIYVGSSIDIEKRWTQHLYAFRTNKHRSRQLQRHYKKYGEADLLFTVIVGCDKEGLLKLEQFYLDSYNPYFNSCITAGSNLGIRFSDEVKNKNRIAHLGQKPWCTGKKLTEEHRKSQSLAKLGKKRKPHTEETKEKMRIAANNKIPVLQFDRQGNFIKEWESLLSVKLILSVSDNNIRLCINGNRKSAGNFIWKRKVA